MSDIVVMMNSKPVESSVEPCVDTPIDSHVVDSPVDEVITPENIVSKIRVRGKQRQKEVKKIEQVKKAIVIEPEPIVEKPKRKTKKAVEDKQPTEPEPIVEKAKPKPRKKKEADKQPEEVKEPEIVAEAVPVKKPRGRPTVDRWPSIEARIRGNEFKGADRASLVMFVSRSLGDNPDHRTQMSALLKELGHTDVMMIFSMN
jgi:hypothetical protein